MVISRMPTIPSSSGSSAISLTIVYQTSALSLISELKVRIELIYS